MGQGCLCCIIFKRKTLCATKTHTENARYAETIQNIALSRFVRKSGIGSYRVHQNTMVYNHYCHFGPDLKIRHTHVEPLPLVPPWLAPLFQPFQTPARHGTSGRSENGSTLRAASLSTINYGKRETVLGKIAINQLILRYPIFRKFHVGIYITGIYRYLMVCHMILINKKWQLNRISWELAQLRFVVDNNCSLMG